MRGKPSSGELARVTCFAVPAKNALPVSAEGLFEFTDGVVAERGTIWYNALPAPEPFGFPEISAAAASWVA